MHLNILEDNDELIKAFFDSLDKIRQFIDGIDEISGKTLYGEKYITDEELSKQIHLSRRTLQDYRTNGKIPYYQIGGKVLYKASDIIKLLEEGYRSPYAESK